MPDETMVVGLTYATIEQVAELVAAKVRAVSSSRVPPELLNMLEVGRSYVFDCHPLLSDVYADMRVRFSVEPGALVVSVLVYGGQLLHEIRLSP